MCTVNDTVQIHVKTVFIFISCHLFSYCFELSCASLYFSALLTGSHSKKQGEDLSENDGDEDEGISMVAINNCMCPFKGFSDSFSLPPGLYSSFSCYKHSSECLCVSSVRV